ncbi:MAG: hypothetical protein ACFCVH_18560 [Alphaproteobacteria bacterium]
MNLVLRLGGDEVDIDNLSRLTTLVPYRIERLGVGKSKTNCLFYNIDTTRSVKESEGFTILKNFLHENRIWLDSVEKVDGVTFREVDIGLIISSNMAAKTVTMDPDLLRYFGDLGLSLTVSIYKGSEAEGEALN